MTPMGRSIYFVWEIPMSWVVIDSVALSGAPSRSKVTVRRASTRHSRPRSSTRRMRKGGVDPVWFAILAGINLQTSFLTPPVGWALFFLKGVAPPEASSMDIYKGVIPFIVLQLIVLVFLFQYPQIATWLPDAIGW